jgi:hypothetical protein
VEKEWARFYTCIELIEISRQKKGKNFSSTVIPHPSIRSQKRALRVLVKNIIPALGCFGFSAELSSVFLEVVEKSPTKQRLRRG